MSSVSILKTLKFLIMHFCLSTKFVMENILFHFLFILKQAGRLHLRIRETEIKGANNIKKINS